MSLFSGSAGRLGGNSQGVTGQTGDLPAASAVGIRFTGRGLMSMFKGTGRQNAGGQDTAEKKAVPHLVVPPRPKPGEIKIPDWIKKGVHVWHVNTETGWRAKAIVEFVNMELSEVGIESASGGVWKTIPFKVIAGEQNPLVPMEPVPAASTSPAQSKPLGVAELFQKSSAASAETPSNFKVEDQSQAKDDAQAKQGPRSKTNGQDEISTKAEARSRSPRRQ